LYICDAKHGNWSGAPVELNTPQIYCMFVQNENFAVGTINFFSRKPIYDFWFRNKAQQALLRKKKIGPKE
jgi:hypothetical protein